MELDVRDRITEGIEARQGQYSNQVPGGGLVYDSPARRRACAGAPSKGRQPLVSCFQLKKPDLSIGKLGEPVLAPARRMGRKLTGFELLIRLNG